MKEKGKKMLHINNWSNWINKSTIDFEHSHNTTLLLSDLTNGTKSVPYCMNHS
jgi:hypothetical protein